MMRVPCSVVWAAVTAAVLFACAPGVPQAGCFSDGECRKIERCIDDRCVVLGCDPAVCTAGGGRCVQDRCIDLDVGAPCGERSACTMSLTCEEHGDGRSLCALPLGEQCFDRDNNDATLDEAPCAGSAVGCVFDDVTEQYRCVSTGLTCDAPDGGFTPVCIGADTLLFACAFGDQPYGVECSLFETTCETDHCAGVALGGICADVIQCANGPAGCVDGYCRALPGERCTLDGSLQEGATFVSCTVGACVWAPADSGEGGVCLSDGGSCSLVDEHFAPECRGDRWISACNIGTPFGIECAAYGGTCAPAGCRDVAAGGPCVATVWCEAGLVCGDIGPGGFGVCGP